MNTHKLSIDLATTLWAAVCCGACILGFSAIQSLAVGEPPPATPSLVGQPRGDRLGDARSTTDCECGTVQK